MDKMWKRKDSKGSKLEKDKKDSTPLVSSQIKAQAGEYSESHQPQEKISHEADKHKVEARNEASVPNSIPNPLNSQPSQQNLSISTNARNDDPAHTSSQIQSTAVQTQGVPSSSISPPPLPPKQLANNETMPVGVGPGQRGNTESQSSQVKEMPDAPHATSTFYEEDELGGIDPYQQKSDPDQGHSSDAGTRNPYQQQESGIVHVSNNKPGLSLIKQLIKPLSDLMPQPMLSLTYNERTLTHNLNRARREAKEALSLAQSRTNDLNRARREAAEALNLAESKSNELNRRIKELKAERNAWQEAYESLARQKQEASFKKMDPGAWLPMDENKVRGELSRIRAALKSWAKKTAVADWSFLNTLDDTTGLIAELSNVCAVENDSIPNGLESKKGLSLLLNAIASHYLFVDLFRNPFFFFRDSIGELAREPPERHFNNMYRAMVLSNEREGHIWRSQTLRLLSPPLKKDSKPDDISLSKNTKEHVIGASIVHAENFLAGPARYIMNLSDSLKQELRNIFQQGAEFSYQLWAQRTSLRVWTLKDMGNPKFNHEDQSMEPHSLVRYDNHKDYLRGQPITVIVQPQLIAHGTDEGERYNEWRVLSPAVVWLDSLITA